jgi:hypothetical protein
MLELTPYANEAQSVALYVGHPRIRAVHFQHTETGGCLLDIELEYRLHDSAGKVLFRLEGATREIHVLAEAIAFAMQNPRPHPSMADLFQSAVAPLPTWTRGIRELEPFSREVDAARVRVAQIRREMDPGETL